MRAINDIREWARGEGFSAVAAGDEERASHLVDVMDVCDRLEASADLADRTAERASREAEALRGRIAVLEEEVSDLRAQIAEAKGLRLDRPLTVEEASRHADASGDRFGRWLLTLDDGAYWEMFHVHVEDGAIIIDEVDDDGARLAMISDAIPLDKNDHPCPIGGWKE